MDALILSHAVDRMLNSVSIGSAMAACQKNCVNPYAAAEIYELAKKMVGSEGDSEGISEGIFQQDGYGIMN